MVKQEGLVATCVHVEVWQHTFFFPIVSQEQKEFAFKIIN